MARVGRSRHDRDDLLVFALAVGGDREQAARSANVSIRTVTRRLADPAFAAQVQRRRAELVEKALGRASGHALRAVDTLAELMARAESESVRARAATALLDLVVRRSNWQAERASADDDLDTLIAERAIQPAGSRDLSGDTTIAQAFTDPSQHTAHIALAAIWEDRYGVPCPWGPKQLALNNGRVIGNYDIDHDVNYDVDGADPSAYR